MVTELEHVSRAFGLLYNAMHLPPRIPRFKHFCQPGEECRCEEEYERVAEQRCDEAREWRDD